MVTDVNGEIGSKTGGEEPLESEWLYVGSQKIQ